MTHAAPKTYQQALRLSGIVIMILAIAFPLSPAQAAVVREEAHHAVDTSLQFFRRLKDSLTAMGRFVSPQVNENPAQRAAAVATLQTCPQRLLLYVGEEYTLAPLPLSAQGLVVQGVACAWESGNKAIASVVADGRVTAVANGTCELTGTIGSSRTTVTVEVRAGQRPRLTNAQWDAEHAQDCSGSQVAANLPDPDDPGNTGGAALPVNAIGNPRFSPAEVSRVSATQTENQLGSSSFNFSVPIFGAPGRGVGLGLALTYNSRLWTDSGGTLTFDYDQGWPTPGFRLNYGRIIQNYDAYPGNPGNHLLIDADGTRIPLVSQNDGTYLSDDGQFIQYDTRNGASKLIYLDGTVISYALTNNKLLPNSIQDINGNSVVIDYVGSCSTVQRVESCTCGSGGTCQKPPRQAINQITDTLGRHVTFYYYANGNLAEIRAPGYNNGPDRVVAKFYYQPLTLSYNFDPNLQLLNVPPTLQIDVLRRVYFPDTGRGYIFDQYADANANYGMFKRISTRLGMTEVADGTEAAYTEYGFQTAGTLSDAPQFTERREWWMGKTDSSGNPDTYSSYTYERTLDSATSTMTNKITTTALNLRTEMISNNNNASPQYGLLMAQKTFSTTTNTLLSQVDYEYSDSSTSQAGKQRTRATITDDATPTANRVREESEYGIYGRLLERIEYGFPNAGGSFRKQRRTVYGYHDGSGYTLKGMKRLVTDVQVYDAKLTNSNSDDVLIGHTHYLYDCSDCPNPDPDWSLETYGFTDGCTTCGAPPGYDTSLVSRTSRGNVTKVQLWTDLADPNALPQISFRHRYDIFGNEVKSEISCCSLKRQTFNNSLWWSAPISVIDGAVSGPSLTNLSFYDFNTGFLKQETDPNNLSTVYTPDAAMRLRTITYPKLASDPNASPTLETFFADPNYPNKDGLIYQIKQTYMDGTTQRVEVSNQWLDGIGNVLRAGSAAGATPSSFDAAKIIYDSMGRVKQSTNPYSSDVNGLPTGAVFSTVYDYDALGRVNKVTMPGGNTIETTYNGVVTTVTDQVGRQKRSEEDGLGRTIKVTEMDAAKNLTWATTCTYDLNNNLIGSNQGGQTRAFKYDALSRVLFERTPEQDATINDGSGTLWSAKYTYTDVGALSTREDARHVRTTYSYDALNRPYNVAYDVSLTNPLVPATPAVSVIYGSTAPELGQVKTITDGVGTETYSYDGLSRVQSKIRSIDSRSYTTGYLYNQTGQLTRLTYPAPSNRQIDYGYDTRGRLLSVGGTRAYLTSITYNPSQQLDTLQLANGLTENYGYSADRRQLTSQTVKRGTSSPMMSLSYNYNADSASGGGTKAGNSGQLISLTATINGQNRDQSFKYDQVGRLGYASGKDSSAQTWQRRYTYDRWGNRSRVEEWRQAQIPNVFDWCTKQLAFYTTGMNGAPTTNRMAEVDTVVECDAATVAHLQYDAAGNETDDNWYKYTYDGESRLVKVINLAQDTPNQYWYDAGNRRVKKVTPAGETTHYIWEGGQVIAEYKGTNGQLQAEYIYAGSRMLAQETGTTLRYFHQDRLATRMITDGNGNWAGTMSEEPFGEAQTENGESNKHRFTTYERDAESDSDYAVNRQYASRLGRFTRPDPVSGSIANPQSFNRYVYTLNDPLNHTDPLGLNASDCPSEFSSCASVDVLIPGIGVRQVTVGFSGGGGHATFLWGSALSQRDYHYSLEVSRINLRNLPEGFDIFPSKFETLINEKPGSITGRARNKIAKQINQELADCEKVVGQQAFNDHLKSKNLDLNFLHNRVLKSQAAGNASQIASSAGTAFLAARAGLSITPPMAILNAMSMFGVLPSFGDSVTWQDLLSGPEIDILNEAAALRQKAKHQCRKNVRRKYGLY